MTEVSSTRLYLGNLPRNVTKQDIEEHFSTHGSGKITEIKLMNGFGFIEYEDAMDARDVVPAFHGSDFKGERLTVQFARGPRRKENFPGPPDRPTAPRPRRTMFRMQIAGLPETSWQVSSPSPFPPGFPGLHPPWSPLYPNPSCLLILRPFTGLLALTPGSTDPLHEAETRPKSEHSEELDDLKDFARQSGLDVVYSETGREQGRGFVEFETANDLKTAVDKLDQREFKGSRVTCTADIQSFEDRPYRDPYRSRSPRRPYPPMDEYDRRFSAPRGYSPRDHYRERSPIPMRRDYYDRDGYGRRTPPRPRMEDYPPPRRPYDDPYDARPPPPPRPYDDPYLAARSYGRPRSPPRSDYVPYERPRYW
ncbi:uncharacterized protein N7459_004340 [Penicillium hispanicum]|uniref:uncharacterized protein n=1 Tax=Penicillium hispanicum TaxID=1080232 RepID=UPI002541A02A|nr:uncharacterized protein N7459_004340 [Penicillium hispanicum]KAJ5584540.1 hypothetical protein N7459_004340 [Penicillium hispanicum]